MAKRANNTTKKFPSDTRWHSSNAVFLRHARIPPLYWEAELPAAGALANFAAQLEGNLKEGIGLLLTGPNGSGKTYASCALARQALAFTARVLYIPAPDMVQAFIKHSKFDEDFLMEDAFRNRVLLVIDDVGQEYRGSGSGFSEQNVVNLIRYRITYKRATILTTNMNIEQLTETYGKGFASLLQQGMVTILMSGADRRKEGRKELLEKSGVSRNS